MRSCNPIFVGTRAAGINCQVSAAPRRARRKVLANPQAPSRADPRIARRHECAGARQGVFSLWTVHGPFLFWQDQKRNGGCICPAINMADFRHPNGWLLF